METPEFYQASSAHNNKSNEFAAEKRNLDMKTGENFIIEDLLDFPDDDVVGNDGTLDNVTGNSTDSSAVTVVDSGNSVSGNEAGFAGSFADAQFSNDLCVPYDDMAELEWLSNFVEESFSSEDLQKMQLISGMKAQSNEPSETHQFQPENNRNTPIFRPEVSVPGKARSKRSRAAPCSWTSRLLVVSPSVGPAISSESETGVVLNSCKKTGKAIIMHKKKEVSDNGGSTSSGDGRKCLHCATDKTPQWRTGPMGPKTLCNACGVRYKSGRLVPEYRPAASPTFVLTKHSNSHRKVLELRRQKEMQMAQHHHQQQFLHQNMMFDVFNGEDYLIHQQIGPDYGQMF